MKLAPLFATADLPSLSFPVSPPFPLKKEKFEKARVSSHPRISRKMAETVTELEEIESLLLHSRSNQEKALGYGNLLLFQERLCGGSSMIGALRERLPRLLRPIRADIFVEDEEVASQALKCLGFVIYHPDLVIAIPDGDTCAIVESIVKLITNTKMKAICNLGVWCISMQQFHSSFVIAQSNPLLGAVIYALDNPMGSLSTTFEATQALVKLVSQMSDNMRTLSSMWAPPIYRRLLSLDKKERDMSIRCLQKVKSCILPPLPTLSKVVSADIQQKLLYQLDALLQQSGCKVHAIQAWGWLIRLLGFYTIKHRRLLNQLLKVPEKTFSDNDPQVQIASQVAWEALIDVFVQFHLPMIQEQTGKFDDDLQEKGVSLKLSHQLTDPRGGKHSSTEGSTSDCQSQFSRFQKIIKLLMKPLVGIMSSRCSITVHLSCLKTWCYLLHKLVLLVNCASLIPLVLEPMLLVVFQKGPDNKSYCIWKSCIDLFDDFISSKVKVHNDENVGVDLTPVNITSGDANMWKNYSIKWMSWDLKMLNFNLRMIQSIVPSVLKQNTSSEVAKMASAAVLQLFCSVLKGVKIEFQQLSQPFSSILLSLNMILTFIKDWYEDVTGKFANCFHQELHYATLQLLQTAIEELPDSILSSPLYEFRLDIKMINNLWSADVIQNVRGHLSGISMMLCMDAVSPISFCVLLYLIVGATYSSSITGEILFTKMEKFSQIAFSVVDPIQNLHAVVEMQYIYMFKSVTNGLYWLKVWKVFAKSLKERFDKVISSPFVITETHLHLLVYYLCFPLEMSSSTCLLMTADDDESTGKHVFTSENKHELELIMDTWKSLYDSVNHVIKDRCTKIHFSEGLCQRLLAIVNGRDKMNAVLQSFTFLWFYGEMAIHVLNQVRMPGALSQQRRQQKGDKRNSLEFVARFLQFSLTFVETIQRVDCSTVSRVCTAVCNLLIHLETKDDILLFMEVFSEALVQSLSSFSMLSTNAQVQSLASQIENMWIQLLDCMERSHPPLIYDSSLLHLQAPLLFAGLDHSHATIANATISFWNRTYAKGISLSYPSCLLPVLDKLSRGGKLHLRKIPDEFEAAETSSGPKWLTVTATQKKNSKRVSFMKDDKNVEFVKVPALGLKRKKMELTEHQREVKRLQQGRGRDCMGHGPGLKTYTSMDFSQGNEHSQDTEEPLDADAILKKLRMGS
ncbi:uncharacterized protein LOC116251483 isoform X2 [Nymphaea colorata]|uniref:uncharacterized protein LOC116251483 isoform X2 n=1 Tax=Nymphaea colorata TaxID=210225 RepID=UPI00129EA75C|nr:uncharacterized protein LOC116251483 isoform X2 [Nymphaea colorata]